MCVAAKDATFGVTTIAGSRVEREGRQEHLVLYGNEPTNRHNGANAIMLHVPIAEGMTLSRANFLPTNGLSTSHFLQHLVTFNFGFQRSGVSRWTHF